MKTAVDVHPFSPAEAGDEDLRAYHRFACDNIRRDRPKEPLPAYEHFVGRLRAPFVAAVKYWAAYQGNRLVGVAQVDYPDAENSHTALVYLDVDPEVHRRGVGLALMRTAVPDIMEQGRELVTCWSVIRGTAGEFFAETLGGRVVSERLLLWVHMSTRPVSGVAPPADYRLESWVGTAPDDLVESYARARMAIEDAPTGDTGINTPDWTVNRVREVEADLRERKIEHHVVVAVHNGTGEVAGLTELEIHPHRDDWAYQGDTAVSATHRGHGLGRAMKAWMMDRIADTRPGVEVIVTTTAADNVHMVRVNTELGFETFRNQMLVEAQVKDLLPRLVPS